MNEEMNVTSTWLIQAVPVRLHEFVTFSSQCFGTQDQQSSAEQFVAVQVSVTYTDCSLCLYTFELPLHKKNGGYEHGKSERERTISKKERKKERICTNLKTKVT